VEDSCKQHIFSVYSCKIYGKVNKCVTTDGWKVSQNAPQQSLFNYQQSVGVLREGKLVKILLASCIDCMDILHFTKHFQIVSCKCFQSHHTDNETKLHPKDVSLHSPLSLLWGCSEPQFLIFPPVHSYKIKTNKYYKGCKPFFYPVYSMAQSNTAKISVCPSFPGEGGDEIRVVLLVLTILYTSREVRH
jgi:hypothetical protein